MLPPTTLVTGLWWTYHHKTRKSLRLVFPDRIGTGFQNTKQIGWQWDRLKLHLLNKSDMSSSGTETFTFEKLELEVMDAGWGEIFQSLEDHRCIAEAFLGYK